MTKINKNPYYAKRDNTYVAGTPIQKDNRHVTPHNTGYGITEYLPIAGDVTEAMDIIELLRKNDYEEALIKLGLIAIPGNISAAIKSGKRVFLPVSKYGKDPIYKDLPKDMKIREPEDIYNPKETEDYVEMNYNTNRGKRDMSPIQVGRDITKKFEESAHGRIVAFMDNLSLSTDSAPLFIKFISNNQKKGLGKAFIPAEGVESHMRLNSFGNAKMTQETLDNLNASIKQLREETGLDIPDAYIKTSIVRGFGKEPTQYIMFPKIGFFKYDKGGKIK